MPKHAPPCLTLTAVIVLATSATASADEWQGSTFLGSVWLLTNDHLGDLHDRWRSASLQAGFVFARPGTDLDSYAFGDVVELRLGAEFLTPEELDDNTTDARPLATAVTVGLHAHARRGATDLALGLYIYSLGSQTGLGGLLDDVHPSLSEEVRDAQITERFVPTLTGEVARNVALLPGLTFRPFAEIRAGVETYARLGFDMILGPGPETTVPARDVTTGQVLWLTGQDARGWTLIAGGDVAHVFDSLYLPEDRADIDNPRVRLRAGGMWRGDRFGLFYGVTWLGEEFEGQREPQITGSIQIDLRF